MQSKPAFNALVSAVVLAALTLSGCNGSSDQQQSPPPEVGFVTIETQPFQMTTELPGRTTAYRIAEVRPQVNGIIQKRLFKEGSDVKAGEQLYQIDPAVYEANYQSAQATLSSTRALAQRYKPLAADRAVSQQAYDDARASFLQAEAAVKQAEIDLRYTKVLAPIDGRIGRSNVTEGALVNNGQATAMATIQQLDPIYVDVTQSTQEMLNLRRALSQGQLQRDADNNAKVRLTLDDGSTYAHEGTMEFTEVSVDETTGSVTIRAVFPNPDHLLLPGMFVHAQLETGIDETAILAPQQGITRTPKGEATAMVVVQAPAKEVDNEGNVKKDENGNEILKKDENGQVIIQDIAEQRILKTARTVGNQWLVTDGLKAGDRLITQGLQFIRPGAPVKAAPATNINNGDNAEESQQPAEPTAPQEGSAGAAE